MLIASSTPGVTGVIGVNENIKPLLVLPLHPLFAPYCNDAVVCHNGKCCNIKVLRDTAALQSLLLESSVPSTAYAHTGEVRLLKGCLVRH